MGLKKYEIITVGGSKRVRALRSWQVGGRYVNIGDVGGIVYDEKTLSQDGLCWLFSGNFGFPGARIGGDSIVDVVEVTNTSLSAAPAPAVDILGSSVVVGSKLKFATDQTAADAVVLTADDFEQGAFGTYIIGQPLAHIQSADYVRTKNPIFLGGKSLTVKLEVPGYSVGAVSVDRDGLVIAPVAAVTSGEDVTLTIPAGQYAYIRLGKNPTGPTVPADATAAAITFTGVYKTSISIIDSRVEINPATNIRETTIKPGGIHALNSAKNNYPEAVIRNSKVSIDIPATTNRSVRLMGQIIGSTAMLDATARDVTVAGLYSNINNLMASGAISDMAISSYDIIQVTDCDNFAVSPTIFPDVAAAQTANMPFIFQGCNVPDGLFYHHAQIKNTYKNIDFALASGDLGKSGTNAHILVSSELEGMYRLYSTVAASFGAVVESYESIRDSGIGSSSIAATYGTTIYKDAYFKGAFEFAGTNVFGSKSPSHPIEQVLNVQPRVVQGNLNSTIIGNTVTGVVPDNRYSVIPIPLRVNGPNGITVQGLPGNLKTLVVFVTPTGTIKATDVITSAPLPAIRLPEIMAYIRFGNADNTSPVTPADLAGVTVTVYNGCKIVNTKASALNIAGNVRVEDNATLIDTSVTGTGYFGGNSVIAAPTALTAPMPIEGAAYMKDNAVFSPVLVAAGAGISLLDMKNNAVFAGTLSTSKTFYNITMADNARFLGLTSTRSGFVMRGNSFVGASATIVGACKGLLVMTGKARIESGNLTAVGYITLTGNYRQTATKVWTGKRVIDSQDAPQYDNNVKTQYDF